jgi:predicted ATPase
VQIAALRKALGAHRDLIRTVAGRGYQFTGELRAASVAVPASSPATNLATPVSELIGRDAELREVTDLVRAHRLVTLTGAGGIGKTRLGLEAGRELLPTFAGGVWIAELGPLSDPELVSATVAVALGLTLGADTLSPERVAAALGPREVLLVLDNCEHVIEAAARMAEALLRASPVARVMATSREPLRAAGEFVHRVPGLDVPAEGTQATEELLQSGAVRLFVARSLAANPHFATDGHIAAVVAAICRRLDGIPLAIELAPPPPRSA